MQLRFTKTDLLFATKVTLLMITTFITTMTHLLALVWAAKTMATIEDVNVNVIDVPIDSLHQKQNYAPYYIGISLNRT